MGEKTAGVGHFAIPTAPAAGTSCTSGAANVFTTTYVQLSAAVPAAIFITGIYVEQAAVAAGTYIVVQLATGAAASEVVVGQHLIAPVTGSTVARCYKPIWPPIAVANGIRVACKTADSVGALASLITLECINQSNVVDDGVAVATVTTVTNQLTAAAVATAIWQDATAGDFTTASSIGKALYVSNIVPGAAGGHFIAGTNAATTITTGLTTTFTGNLTGSVASVTGAVGSVTGAVGSVTGAVGSVTGLTASNLDATITSRMASYTQPTGFLAATFPAGTIANTTNITAGTITTTTNLTNAATAGDLTATMKTSVTTAATAATPTAAAVTGAVGSVTGNVGGNVVGSVASVTAAVTLPTIPSNWISAAGIAAAALNGKGDWNIGKTGYSLTQTFPSNFAAAVISATGVVDSNIAKVNGITVTGSGTVGSPWGP